MASKSFCTSMMSSHRLQNIKGSLCILIHSYNSSNKTNAHNHRNYSVVRYEHGTHTWWIRQNEKPHVISPFHMKMNVCINFISFPFSFCLNMRNAFESFVFRSGVVCINNISCRVVKYFFCTI